MCVNRSSVRIVLVMLLFAVANSQRWFDYNILNTYRNVIYPELHHHLNLTVSSFTFEGKDCCPSAKVRHIFRSICGMTKQYLNNTGQQEDIRKVVKEMDILITESCKWVGMMTEKRNTKCKDATLERLKDRCLRRRKRRKDHCHRQEKVKLVQMLVLCWQKLQSAIPQDWVKGKKRN